MPFKVVKVRDGYRLKKIKTGKFTRGTFKTRRSAVNMGKNWEAHDVRLGRLSHKRAVARRRTSRSRRR